jgi:hypothetical protein
MGELFIVAMIVNEIDMSLQNIGLDEKMRVIKLDGGRCFARLWDKSREAVTITSADINNLPFIQHYRTTHWLDLIINEKAIPEDKISEKVFNLVSNTLFRAEINKSILKNLLMPDDLLQQFFGTSESAIRDAEEKVQSLQQKLRAVRQQLNQPEHIELNNLIEQEIEKIKKLNLDLLGETFENSASLFRLTD